MSAFNTFLATWSDARATFGSGRATEGVEFDESRRLQQLQTTAHSATPGSTWTGSGSDAYTDANTHYANIIGKFAGLDQRLAVEIDRSADVVTAGRRALDDVRQRAVDAANLTPNTTVGQLIRSQIAGKGAAEIAEIVNRSNSDLSTVAERIRNLGSEYQTLGFPTDKPKNDEQSELPPTTLDLNDIVYQAPYDPDDKRTWGPTGFMELVPNSGAWVPDPRSRYYKPTSIEKPLDLDDIVQLAPRAVGPSGYIELVPGSGTWVPDPDGSMWPTSAPTAPVDLAKIAIADPTKLGQPGYMELVPHSGVWVPDPSATAAAR